MNRSFFFIALAAILFTIDWYVWQAVRTVIRTSPLTTQRWATGAYWGLSLLTLGAYIIVQLLPPDYFNKTVRNFVFAGIAIPYFSKLFAVLFLLVDDVRRLVQWGISQFVPSVAPVPADPTLPRIPRSEFLSTTALIAGGGLLGTFAYGIISGAHDYRFRRVKIALKNLPKEFDGIRIAQLSDIHSGSFFNKTAVKGGVEMEWLDAHELIQRMALPYEDRITLDLQATAPYVLADRLHFGNLVNNLIDNALKYSPRHPDVTVRTFDEGTKLVLAIRDKGIGIAPEHQTKIFEKFYRVSEGNVHNVKGFGIGLSYVRQIVKAHRWKLHLTSEPGQGSEFTIYIPKK